MNGSVREFLELGPKTVLDGYSIVGSWEGAHLQCDHEKCRTEVDFSQGVPELRTLRQVLEWIEQHEKTHVLRHYTEVADGT